MTLHKQWSGIGDNHFAETGELRCLVCYEMGMAAMRHEARRAGSLSPPRATRPTVALPGVGASNATDGDGQRELAAAAAANASAPNDDDSAAAAAQADDPADHGDGSSQTCTALTEDELASVVICQKCRVSVHRGMFAIWC